MFVYSWHYLVQQVTPADFLEYRNIHAWKHVTVTKREREMETGIWGHKLKFRLWPELVFL